jgi:hypothetical protein
MSEIGKVMLHAKNMLGLMALGVALNGCTTTEDAQTSMFTTPGQYVLFDCQRLAQRADELGKREQELKVLMAKAGDDASGKFVSTLAYRNEYLTVRGELGEIAKEAARKDCNLANPRQRPQPAPPAPRKRKEQRA